MPDGDMLATVGSRFFVERTGVAKIDLMYVVPGPTSANEDEPFEALYKFLPPELPMGLPPIARSAQKTQDGDWELTLTCEGIPVGFGATLASDESLIEVEIDHAGQDDPIETFSGFDALSAKYKARIEDGKFEGWTPKIPDPASGKIVKNPLFGFSHYLNDAPVLRVTYTSLEFDRTWLDNICKIEAPNLPSSLQFLANDVPNGKTWLKKSCRVRYRGNVWQATPEYLLGVWVPDVYLPKSG